MNGFISFFNITFTIFLYRCKHCIEACFCSQQCRRIAWNKFHKWECGFGLKLSYMIGIAHLGFRVALIGFTEPSNPEYQRVKDLQQHIHSLEADDLYQYTLVSKNMLYHFFKEFKKKRCQYCNFIFMSFIKIGQA